MNWFTRLFRRKPKPEPEPPPPRPKAGPDIIGRQAGQKRNRIHLYRQPFGYPIRACDWIAVDMDDLEVLGVWDEANTRAKTPMDNALLYYASAKGFNYCRHCLAVAQGKRTTVGETNFGHGKGAA